MSPQADRSTPLWLASSAKALERLLAMGLFQVASRVVESSGMILCRWLASPGWPVEYISTNVALWGYSAPEMMANGRLFIELVHPADRKHVIEEVARHVRQQHQQFRCQYRILTATGEVLWIEEHSGVEYDAQDRVVRFEGVLNDITARKGQEQREKGRNRVLSLLAGGADLPVILDALARNVELEDPELLCCITLVERERHRLVVGAAPSLDPDFQQGFVQHWNDSLPSAGPRATGRQIMLSPDIQVDHRWAGLRQAARNQGMVACWSAPVLSSEGTVLGMFTLFHRRHRRPSPARIRAMREFANLAAIAIERTRHVQTLRENAERWRFALEAAGDGVFDWDVQTDILTNSRRCSEMLGYNGHQPHCLRSQDWFARIHPDDLDRVREHLAAHLAGHIPQYTCEQRVRGKAGEWCWLHVRGLVVRRDTAGVPLRMVGTVSDITARKHMEQELRAMATTDHLTGLANRRHFMGRMQEEVLRMDRNADYQAAVMMLDLDHFKRVNDTHGHSAGDAVLRHFAALVRHCLRKNDAAGRMGGEEFAVLLPDTDLPSAQALAERLRVRVARIPARWEGVQIPVTVSIGITLLSALDLLPDHALQRADEALYQAKTGGRNRVEVIITDPATADS
ncbi:diguanylate cyclase [Ectothiorhodospira magna]|nr:diguanylate cyclase [Ectothiorhodospira magna]